MTIFKDLATRFKKHSYFDAPVPAPMGKDKTQHMDIETKLSKTGNQWHWSVKSNGKEFAHGSAADFIKAKQDLDAALGQITIG